MSTTLINRGDVMEFPAPAGGVIAGSLFLIGGFACIAQLTAAAGTVASFYVAGAHALAKTINEGALVVGQAAFWDVANAKVTIDPSLGLPIGAIATAALTGDTACIVRLNGTGLAGRMFTTRKRFTIAQVNAGATLIPALPGLKIRMVDALAIAIGGAAAAVTTVDILGTVSTVRKLVALAQASLTQSTVLRAGGAGAAVLADGASFTANDAGTAITVGKTGADVTTATHVDVLLTYSLE